MERMRDQGNNRRGGRKWFGWKDVIYLTIMVVAVVAMGSERKIRRTLREFFPPPQQTAVPDAQAIYRAAETKISSEWNEKYDRDIAALKKTLEETEKKRAEDSTAVRSITEIGTVTDVRKLRSGIPFKSEVEIQKGDIASKERVDDNSYTATYELLLRVPTPATTVAHFPRLRRS